MDLGRLSDSFKELESAHAAKESHHYYVDREGTLRKKGLFERFTLLFKGHPDEDARYREIAAELFTKLQSQYQSENSSSREGPKSFLSRQVTYEDLDKEQVGRILRVTDDVLDSKERPTDLVPKFYEQFRDVLSVRHQEQVRVTEFLNENPSVQSFSGLKNAKARLTFLQETSQLLTPSMGSDKDKKDVQERCNLSDKQMETLQKKFDGLEGAIIKLRVQIAVEESSWTLLNGDLEKTRTAYDEVEDLLKDKTNSRTLGRIAVFLQERIALSESDRALKSGDLKKMKKACEEVALALGVVDGNGKNLLVDKKKGIDEKKQINGRLNAVNEQLRQKMAEIESDEALKSGDLEKMKTVFVEVGFFLTKISASKDMSWNPLWTYSRELRLKISELEKGSSANPKVS
ncbi:hypothetical protein JYU14_05280 [Simkania negevensis]|uniref:PX domain-containing protein n=1 Tax=Simkania negevensis TaxID=83561 RepID=A0ABS3AV62_9BACT|nr:hypothetical protein [Simkania negevensis]